MAYYDSNGERHGIGEVKIAQFGMTAGQASAAVPETFEELDQSFFSVGQDDSYYERPAARTLELAVLVA